MSVLRLDVPGWHPADPGQFALLQTEASSRFLPRAFSVMAQEGEQISFLISPIGPGSEELSEARVGEGVWVLGPLGRGFDLSRMLAEAVPLSFAAPAATGGVSPPVGVAAAAAKLPVAGEPPAALGAQADEPRRLVVVAGGVGLAPFPLLLEAVARLSAPLPEVLVLLGFRDAAQAAALDLLFAPLASLRLAGARVRTEAIAEDGSLGRSGMVTALLAEELREGDAVAACGSHGMCEAVWQVCQARGDSVGGWFSLEATMACGVGSCQGCVIPMADGSLVRVCRQGPVFAGDEVFGGRHDGRTSADTQRDPEAEGR